VRRAVGRSLAVPIVAHDPSYPQGRVDDTTRVDRRCALETMIGIAALLVGAGILWLCFALGVYFFTRTGREGMRIQRMEDERRERRSSDT
jgi:hypothetical protein